MYDLGVNTAIGFLKNAPMGTENLYQYSNQWLYASYAQFCRECGVNIMSRGRFEPLLMDICTHQLKLKVFSKRSTKGLRIYNVIIRNSSPKYEGWPSIIEVASDKEQYKEFYGVELTADNSLTIEDQADAD